MLKQLLVTVYTKPACHQCTATKRHLQRLKIGFESKPMDPNVIEAATYLGLSCAPIVCVSIDGDEQAWAGYRPDRIDALVRAS